MKHFRWLHYLLFLIQFCWGFYKMKFPYLSFIGFYSAYLKIAAKSPILPLYVGEFMARMTYIPLSGWLYDLFASCSYPLSISYYSLYLNCQNLSLLSQSCRFIAAYAIPLSAQARRHCFFCEETLPNVPHVSRIPRNAGIFPALNCILHTVSSLLMSRITVNASH